jgi:hypothetical protein
MMTESKRTARKGRAERNADGSGAFSGVAVEDAFLMLLILYKIILIRLKNKTGGPTREKK